MNRKSLTWLISIITVNFNEVPAWEKSFMESPHTVGYEMIHWFGLFFCSSPHRTPSKLSLIELRGASHRKHFNVDDQPFWCDRRTKQKKITAWMYVIWYHAKAIWHRLHCFIALAICVLSYGKHSFSSTITFSHELNAPMHIHAINTRWFCSL